MPAKINCKIVKGDGKTVTVENVKNIELIPIIDPVPPTEPQPPIPEPEPQPAPTPQPTPSPEPMPTEDKDIFGIKLIYPTLQNGEKWFMDMINPTADKRFNPQSTITKNADGSYKCKSNKVRMNVYTSTGYDSKKITTVNQSELAKKGYMQGVNDWKNVEITGYVKVNAFSAMDNFAWYARGGKHSDVECEGTAYKDDLFWDGVHRYAKEQWHAGGYSYSEKKKVCNSIANRWCGFKAVMFNTPKGAVKLETYVDYECNNDWKKVDERLDTGSWGKEGAHCSGTPAQIISWGGPIACFRWDSTTDVDFKFFSVREIAPPVA